MRALSIARACMLALMLGSNQSRGAGPVLPLDGDDAALAGQVVDTSGQPVANALVVATPLTELPMRQALRLETRSDKDGIYRFDTALRDIDYCLELWASGYVYQTASSRSGRSPAILLEPASTHRVSGTVRLAETGEGAAGAKVVLIGEKGYASEVVSLDDGRFEFTDVPENVGQAVLYAYGEGRHSQYVMIPRHGIGADLTIAASAFLQGRCVPQAANSTIRGCRVIARPPFMSGFALEAETGGDGTYRFGPMPSGAYIVYAQHPEWFQPPTRGDFLEPEEIRIGPGVNSAWDIAMLPKSRVAGVVFGPDGLPVSGATVTIPSAIAPIYDTVYAIGRTDADGRFALHTHRLHPALRSRSVEIAAFSDMLGTGVTCLTATAEPGAAVPRYDDVAVRLAGRMRISGHVSDSEGAPLSDVTVYIRSHTGPVRRTETSGTYDTDWFPLPSDTDAPITVTFRAPRPHNGEMNILLPASERKAATPPDPNVVYVLHRSLTVAPEHGRIEALDAVLPRTDLLTFSGTVTDLSGSPASQVQVMLFAGNAKVEEWLESMHPERMKDGWKAPSRPVYVPLARTVTDEEGGFTLYVARESRESLRIGHWGVDIDLSLFSLGVESLDGSHQLISDVRMSDHETEKRIDIRLP